MARRYDGRMSLTTPTLTGATTMADTCHTNSCHHDHGHAADHMAYESMTTPKDVVAAIGVVSNRQSDSAADLGRQIQDGVKEGCENRGQILSGLARVHGDLSTQAEKLGAASAVQAEKLAAASVLQAEKLAAAAALAACECCDEIKSAIAASRCDVLERIREDGEKTRSLVSQIERERQAVALVDCKLEASNLRQTEVLRGLIAGLAGGPGNSGK